MDTKTDNLQKQGSDDLVISELDICKKQADEYLNGWKRAQADFVNYKKDESKRMDEFFKFANRALILELLEVLDDLYSADRELNNQGLAQVIKKINDILGKYGVERIKVDIPFNPEFHEAVGGMDGEKLEEVRAGYTMGGKVIRPARVNIVK